LLSSGILQPVDW